MTDHETVKAQELTIDEYRQLLMKQLSEAFREFIQKLLAMPCAKIQKTQAFYRFDEGQMWMQNAILAFDYNELKKESSNESKAS